MATTSSFFDRTPERWWNSASSEFAITRAIDVFPHPGGHQRRIDGIRSASINLRIGFHGPIRCDCPTRSSRVSGRRSDASGVMSREKRECMDELYDFRGKCKNKYFYFLKIDSISLLCYIIPMKTP